jgi:hypothetical protein
MTETKSCPACYKVRRISSRLPVCDGCARIIPARAQAEYVSAYLTGDKAAILNAAGVVIRSANDALDKDWQRRRAELKVVGAR